MRLGFEQCRIDYSFNVIFDGNRSSRNSVGLHRDQQSRRQFRGVGTVAGPIAARGYGRSDSDRTDDDADNVRCFACLYSLNCDDKQRAVTNS